MSRHLDFFHEKVGGSNWVLARRTPNIVRRYGENVICISKQRYAAIEKEYRALYGDPYDKVRAAMYLALIAARDALKTVAHDSAVMVDIEAAIEAERNAK